MARQTLFGALEGTHDGILHGWLFDKSRPGERQAVTLVPNCGAELDLVADHYRADLHAAGFGDGHYGFAAPLAWFGPAGVLQARSKAYGTALKGSPVQLDSPAAQVRCLDLDRYTLRLDSSFARRSLTGWIIDRERSMRRPVLVLFSNGRMLARDKACRYRQDVALDGTDQMHGFALTWRERARGSATLLDETTGAVLAQVRLP